MSNCIRVYEEYDSYYAARKFKNGYERSWPWAYGTHLEIIRSKDKFVVKGYRFNSCD